MPKATKQPLLQQPKNNALAPVTDDFFRLAIHEANDYLVKVSFLTALEKVAVYLPDWLDSSISPHPFTVPDGLKYLSTIGDSSDVRDAAKRDLGIVVTLSPILKSWHGDNYQLPAPDNPIIKIISGGFREARALLVPTHVIDKRAEYSWPKDPDAPMKAITAALKTLALS